MKKFSTRYLFILLAGLALTFCSDPVKVGDDSPQITIDAAWFDDVVDDDNDGFRSFARIYFQTSTTEPVNVFFRIGYKEAGSSSYFIYKETSEYSISESETWYVALGDAGYELPQGYYDFSVEIHMGEELVAILTSEDESNIASLGMEPASEELPAISIDQAWIG